MALSTPAASWNGYIGVFADAGHDIYAYCPAAGLYPIEMWIWCLPGDNGQIGAEFGVEYPANIIQSTITRNSGLISVELGELPTGYSVCYHTCQHDWHWILHQTLYVVYSEAGYITIGPHADIGTYQIANCQPGYPAEPVTLLTHLYYNDPCPPGP